MDLSLCRILIRDTADSGQPLERKDGNDQREEMGMTKLSKLEE